ncbi:hypothetical protein HMN09_00919700 [Mycena chlorophos]|uniref:Tetraspanin Tsp2 family n=1 Tax=Mycena chlorophos TaxID=658473 RepID=A0A8H6SJ84_MYCCL|nr:hypothetical protein HMN09_00919700 [Mycena chlorophos]
MSGSPPGHRPTYSRDNSHTSSSMPLMPSTRPISPPSASASSSGSGSYAGTPAAGPSSSSSHPTLRPSIGRNTSENSAALSWIEPEDFNPDTLFDPPAPIRPFSGYERTRTTSADTRTTLFDAAHSRSPSVAMSLSALAAASGGEGNRASTSLSLNYVPSKFSDVLVHPGARRRRRHNSETGQRLLKAEKGQAGAGGLVRAPTMARGGGVDAFRRGEARVADDRDDLHPPVGKKGWMDRAEATSRWTRFKWVLFVFNVVYTIVAVGSVITCLLVWLDIFSGAQVLRVANRTPLVFSTLAASMSLLTCTIGWAGVMLNNRSFLAVYNLFLWFSFAFTVVPGYITFKEHSLNLQGKLNFQWSERLDIDMRRAIQDTLHCCGYASPFVEASISSTCYARSLLPGCQAPFFSFEKSSLEWWYAAVFSVAGYNIGMIVVALLCSNHVTYRFGKGMMPERYRLDEAAVRIIMEEYAQQLEETYGPEVALAALQRASAYALDHNMSDPLTTSASYPGLLMHSRNASTVELGAVPMRPMSYHDPFVRSASALGTPGSEREVGQEVRYGALAGSE